MSKKILGVGIELASDEIKWRNLDLMRRFLIGHSNVSA